MLRILLLGFLISLSTQSPRTWGTGTAESSDRRSKRYVDDWQPYPESEWRNRDPYGSDRRNQDPYGSYDEPSHNRNPNRNAQAISGSSEMEEWPYSRRTDEPSRNDRNPNRNAQATSGSSERQEWSYSGRTGPSSWGESYPECRGRMQSPIDISTKNLQRNQRFGPIVFSGYERALTRLTVENDGRTVEFRSDSRRNLPSIRGGGVTGSYGFSQLHFHWGSDNRRGSEHTINGRQYPMEMHLVHQSESRGGEPQTAVLAVLFKASSEDNVAFRPIVRALSRVTFRDEEAEVEGSISLRSLLPEDVSHYYYYNGSLTTPPCTEGVRWMIFADPVRIGTQQLEAFRRLRSTARSSSQGSSTYISNNFRPTANLNGRRVYEVLPQRRSSGERRQ